VGVDSSAVYNLLKVSDKPIEGSNNVGNQVILSTSIQAKDLKLIDN
jgi:hypothetical protein